MTPRDFAPSRVAQEVREIAIELAEAQEENAQTQANFAEVRARLSRPRPGLPLRREVPFPSKHMFHPVVALDRYTRGLFRSEIFVARTLPPCDYRGAFVLSSVARV